MSPMYPDYYGFSDFSGSSFDDSGVVGAVMGIYLLVLLVSLAYSVLVYVLESVGLYSIAKRRGIHHAWMGWIPLLNMWIFGSISDQYQYVAKGKVRNRRKSLLGMYIALYALMIPVYVIAFMIIGTAGSGEYSGSEAQMIVLALIMLVAALAMLVLSIVLLVFLYMTYYDLFASCNPDNAVMFLVLGIFFNFLLPFFIFACRKKDLGMPPRRPRIPQAPWQSAPPPPAPAWQPPVNPVQPPVWQQPQPPVQPTWQQPVWQTPAPDAPAEPEVSAEEQKTEE